MRVVIWLKYCKYFIVFHTSVYTDNICTLNTCINTICTGWVTQTPSCKITVFIRGTGTTFVTQTSIVSRWTGQWAVFDRCNHWSTINVEWQYIVLCLKRNDAYVKLYQCKLIRDVCLVTVLLWYMWCFAFKRR